MIAPDYVTPITGYRVWKWHRERLISLLLLSDEQWHPNRPHTARCALFGGLATHKAPHLRCTCGIYAGKTLSQHSMVGIYGEVYLWGTVIEHEHGWRAQYAYPKSLFLSRHAGLGGTPRSARDLAPFTAYGADIFLHAEGEDVPLWSAHLGYSADGLKRLADAARLQTAQAERGLSASVREAMSQRKPGDRAGKTAAVSLENPFWPVGRAFNRKPSSGHSNPS